jgi:hypothetical protein
MISAANVSTEGISVADPFIQQIGTIFDCFAEERGFTLWGYGHLTDSEWLRHIEFMEWLQKQGKAFISGNQITNKIQQGGTAWALASYLMGKGKAAYITITGEQDYGKDTWLPEYDKVNGLGAPAGNRFVNDNGIWLRPFEKGLSLVDSSSNTSGKADLPSAHRYHDLDGNEVSSRVILQPHTGLVLLG